MIFFPGISMIINVLIILLAKILRREFTIHHLSLRSGLLSYLIIFFIGLVILNSAIFLINISLTHQSNFKILAVIMKSKEASAENINNDLTLSTFSQPDQLEELSSSSLASLENFSLESVPTNSVYDLPTTNSLASYTDYRLALLECNQASNKFLY